MYLNVLLFIGKFLIVSEVIASILVVDTGILSLEKHSIGIRFYVDVINNDRLNSCTINPRSKKCCLIDSIKENCDTFRTYGGSSEVIKPKDRETLLFVSPMLHQHDLIGHCDFELDCLCNETTDTLQVSIPFDTRINRKTSKPLVKHYVGAEKVTACDSVDEDSLNNCEPVDCTKKYLDQRPIFDRNSHKCVESPVCLTDLSKELPDLVYVPTGNTCRDLEIPLSVQDIYAIISGLGIVTTSIPVVDDNVVYVTSNCTTISQNLKLLKDLMYGKLCPVPKGVIMDYSGCCRSAVQSIVICVVSIFCVLFTLVCCLHTADWLHVKWKCGDIKKCWKHLTRCFKRENDTFKIRSERVDKKVRNALLREVIMKDIPLELRHSVIDVCERVGREVDMKRRYRKEDIGSQISLGEETDSPVSSSSLDNE